MEDLLNMSGGQNTALVIFAFLQADSSNADYNKELHSLGSGINLTRDINCNGSRIDTIPDDGDLETDGHPMSSPLRSFSDLRPSADLQWLIGNHEAAAASHQVAEELRAIGDQLERGAVARATRNLNANLLRSNCEQWHMHLSREVEWVMSNIGLPQHLHHEQVIIAITLTLVKGVCQQTPRFLKNLFSATLRLAHHMLLQRQRWPWQHLHKAALGTLTLTLALPLAVAALVAPQLELLQGPLQHQRPGVQPAGLQLALPQSRPLPGDPLADEALQRAPAPVLVLVLVQVWLQALLVPKGSPCLEMGVPPQ
ncbi:hypothetical protein INR49_005207 [Caranx melampygus]|nr:hypothetical protein INR49_005207 [Caranx melampygus]